MLHSCQVRSCGFIFDDFTIDSLARALPNILNLQLTTGDEEPCNSTACSVTLQGLRAFAEHCPKPVPSPPEFYTISITRCPLNNILFGGFSVAEPLVDQAAIALVFFQLFASLQVMDYSFEGWGNVQRCVRSFQKLN